MKVKDVISNEFVDSLISQLEYEDTLLAQKYYLPEGYHLVDPYAEEYRGYQRFMELLLRAFKDRYLKSILLCYEIIDNPLVLKRIALTAMLSGNKDTRQVYQWTGNLSEDVINDMLCLKDVIEIELNYDTVNAIKTKYMIQLSLARAKYGDKVFINKLIDKVGYNNLFTERKKCTVDRFIKGIKINTSKAFIEFVTYIYGTYGSSEESIKYIANKWNVDETIVRHLFEKYAEILDRRFKETADVLRNSNEVKKLMEEKNGKNKKERYNMWNKHKFILRKAGITYEEFVLK
jgi:hypothetical protein